MSTWEVIVKTHCPTGETPTVTDNGSVITITYGASSAPSVYSVTGPHSFDDAPESITGPTWPPDDSQDDGA
jgi:hypothetical protein